jgi:SHS2 domain-containing protein
VGTLALRSRAGFRLLAHTADIGLEARAPSRGELFIAAAEGVKSLLFGESPAEPTLRREVRLRAGNGTELLVAWLNEILFLCEADRLVPAAFEIVALGETDVAAVITGEVYDPARHVVERTAKAVTYHRLVVEEREKGWYARVYIDL